MKRRSETAEMPGMVDDFKVRHRRLTSQYVEEPNLEIVRQVGQIRGRSRCFMNHPGSLLSGKTSVDLA